MRDPWAQRRSLAASLLVAAALASGCRRKPAEEKKVSAVTVLAERAAPIVMRIPGAEYDIWPTGYVQAYQIQARTAGRYSIEEQEPGPEAWGDKLWVGGRDVTDFVYDFASLKVTDAKSRIGSLGKHAEIKARSKSEQIEKTLSLEVYDDFPNMAVEQLTYLNLADSDIQLERIDSQRHRLDASILNASAQRNDFWSFHGASIEAGRDAVIPIPRDFSQRNLLGAPVAVKGEPGSVGGGIPLVALWTATFGIAIGHLEASPQLVAFPVHTLQDGSVETYMEIVPGLRLKPGEHYLGPRSFVATYNGDYYEPLSLYARILSRQEAPFAEPVASAYDASWSSRADETAMTPAQIIAAIPQLKAMNIHRATLAGRWFDASGDWEPRGGSYSVESIGRMVAELHRQGVLAELAWTPLAVEDGEGGRKNSGSRVAREHPEWLALDKSGHHARMAHNLAVLCPTVPEVREYTKKLVTRFLREWGFDGQRLEDVYTVPECFNPEHHHASPQDSIRAMGELYKEILLTSRSIRAESSVAICPCGTPPNFAWLPYLDTAVMGDTANSAQVRHLIKMYKALLGPQAAVWGGSFVPGRLGAASARDDVGRELAPVVGLGGVPGSRLSWSPGGDKSLPHSLTPEQEGRLQKWLKIYNDLMLSKGVFQNLYVTGFDDPEGYVIQQNGKTYYAFFTAQPDKPWKGELELRGITRGRFRVLDYVEGKVIGTAVSPRLRIPAQFTGFLLLEASLEK